MWLGIEISDLSVLVRKTGTAHYGAGHYGATTMAQATMAQAHYGARL